MDNKKEKTYREGDLLSPSEYARFIGVVPSRVTFLKGSLDKEFVADKWFVRHCEANTKLFENKSPNRKG